MLIVLTVAAAVSIALLFYGRMKQAAYQNADQLFKQSSTIVTQGVQFQRAQILTSLAFVVRSDLALATTFDARRRAVGFLREVLRVNRWVEAAYVGYADGDFVLLRRASPRVRRDLRAPAGTAFVFQTVERSVLPVRGAYTFYNARLRQIGKRVDPGYRYDPRLRPWFRIRRRGVSTTPPYVFFTTKQLGVTYSARSATGNVVGVDIDLAAISEQLARARPTAGSTAALVDPTGAVLAYSDPARLAALDSTHDGALSSLSGLGSPSLAGAFGSLPRGRTAVSGAYRGPDERTWLYAVSPIARGPDASPLLIVSVPEDELLGAAREASNDALILGLLLLVVWIPLTLWLSGFVVRPLSDLLGDVSALQSLDFAHRRRRESPITEIEQLSRAFVAMRTHLGGYASAAGRFVPREFLDQLQRDDISTLELGDHVEREMTILFSDIRSFTTLTESMSPQQTFNFVNSYLTRVGPIVREHGGFIDKYIGDAIMGLFPRRVSDAVDAAVAIQRRVVEYNQERERAGYAPIAIGIGLHYGDLMLGTIGESERYETTVLADAVNVASRLESLTKTFGSQILISGAAVSQLDPAAYALRYLCEVQVKGTSRPLALYEVCDADPAELLDHKRRTAVAFETARRTYAAGDFAAAERLFDAILADGTNDRPAEHFRLRAAELRATDLVAAWDGIERMETK